jgi:hypothetical protein
MPHRLSLEFGDPQIHGDGHPRLRPWQSTLLRIVYIVYSLEVGMFLIFLPWQSFWESNYFLFRFPDLHPIMLNPFLKGAISGLGIVNLLIGFDEILRFRKGSGRPFPR